jgi:hypothetical protein
LALAAGALLPSDLVGSITDLANVWGVLESLHRRGLVEEEDDRFGLPICHAEDYRALLLRYLGLAQAAGELATWVQRQAWSSQEAQSAASAALRIIGYAAERGEWHAVVRLVQAIEPVLALAGRWEAWREVLERGVEAAQTVDDLAAEAHLSHQLGTLEFAVDHLDRARELWQRALELREELGDQAGAAVTRANLALLATATTWPGPPSRRRPSKRAIVLAAVIALLITVFAIPIARSLAGKPPATTVLPTTVPPTTVLPTTVPPTTVPPTTVPPTTVPPTTVPPTTVPPTTVPPTTEPPTTEPPTTEPPTTDPPVE